MSKKQDAAVKASALSNDKIILHDYTENAYLRYSMSVVKERAIPQVQDGQKPVQKRILYDMRELNLGPDAKPSKCARVVGDVLGKLHPHGDSSVYDALVRMAQDFTLRYPIIHGEGNFGSRDGDPAAAYRYCFAAGTRVSTAFGLLPIEELPWICGGQYGKHILTERTELPLSLPVGTRGSKTQNAMFWVNSGFQDTVTVRSRRGYEVRCTPNEPLLVLDFKGQLVWKDASELQASDLLSLRRKPVALVNKQAPFVAGYPAGPAVAELSGFLAGCVIEQASSGLTLLIRDARAAARLVEIVEVLFPGTSVTESESISGTLVTLAGDSVCDLFSRLFPQPGKFSKGTLPAAAFCATPINTVFFLRGFSQFSGGQRRRLGTTYLQFSLPSRAAALELKSLLLCQVGLVSGSIKAKGTDYLVRVGGRNTMSLIDSAINFAHFSAAMLDKSVVHGPVDSNFDAKELGGETRGSVALAARSALRGPNLAALSEAAAEAQAGDYLFESVVSITPAEPCFVFDLTVPGTHAFTANGFVAHNTECKLAAFSDVLLSEVDRGTVDFVPNFDNTQKEPAVLPARLPVILLNGGMGIAVGMASDIPPHNLAEVGKAARLLVEKPKATNDEVLAFIQGPDFPDGGQLISTPEEVRAAYDHGRGALRVRARYEIEELARGQWQIVINEMPYQVKARSILEQIETLCNPQPAKTAKSISQSQSYLKQAALSLLEKATDESGKDAFVRLVIAPCSSKQKPEELMAFLFANTDLESSVSLNLTFIGTDGSPQTRGVAEMLRQWSQFRVDTVRRRIVFDLDKVRRRIHLLEGRMLVFLSVDKVIKCIRESDDPKVDLMAKFQLSDAQAEDILEMRLRQLARLDQLRIEKDLKEAKLLEALLASQISTDKALRKQVASELDADIAKYASPRRTLIKVEKRAETQAAVAKSVVDEPITVLVSKNLWIRARTGHEVDPTTVGWKAGDAELAIIKTRTTQSVLFLDSKGRAYSVDGSAIPAARGDGVPLSTLIELQDGAKLLYVFSGDAEQEYVFCGSGGYGYRAPIKALVARPRAGKAFLALQDSEIPLRPILSNPKGFAACGSSDGRLLIFAVEEIKQLDKGKGVKLQELADGEKMVALIIGEGEPLSLTLAGRDKPYVVKGEDWTKYVGRRGRKGFQLPKKGILIG